MSYDKAYILTTGRPSRWLFDNRLSGWHAEAPTIRAPRVTRGIRDSFTPERSRPGGSASARDHRSGKRKTGSSGGHGGHLGIEQDASLLTPAPSKAGAAQSPNRWTHPWNICRGHDRSAQAHASPFHQSRPARGFSRPDRTSERGYPITRTLKSISETGSGGHPSLSRPATVQRIKARSGANLEWTPSRAPGSCAPGGAEALLTSARDRMYKDDLQCQRRQGAEVLSNSWPAQTATCAEVRLILPAAPVLECERKRQSRRSRLCGGFSHDD